MPKVSVIIPVYGVENYIERCARSLFEQTFDDIEYLFIDDCTPDRSIEVMKQVLDEYPQRKPQVVIHQMEKNSGLAAVRRWGILNATGKYVIQCDSDDWVDADLISTMYEKAMLNNLDVVICDAIRTDGISNILITGGYNMKKNDCILKMMHRKIWWSLCNKLFRRELFDNIIYPDGALGEDMCLCLQLMCNARFIGYVHGKFYYYCINPTSIIMNNSKEKIMSKFLQISDNVEIVKNCFSNMIKEDKRFRKGLLFLEYHRFETLLPLLKDSEVYSLWKSGIKKTAWNVVQDNYATFKCRVKALLYILGYVPK